MCGTIPPFSLYVFMAWCLVKHRDNFVFTLLDVLPNSRTENLEAQLDPTQRTMKPV
jgi:hypothetical protein